MFNDGLIYMHVISQMVLLNHYNDGGYVHVCWCPNIVAYGRDKCVAFLLSIYLKWPQKHFSLYVVILNAFQVWTCEVFRC